MESGLLIALGFAIVIIVLAVGLTRLFRGSPSRRSDANGSRRDGDAAATWVAINRASDDSAGER